MTFYGHFAIAPYVHKWPYEGVKAQCLFSKITPQVIILRLLALICGILAIILTVKDWHPAVYDLTKIILCVSSIGFGLLAMKQKQTPFVWGFYILAVLFNPVFPIRMDNIAWISIDLLAALLFSWRAISPLKRFLEVAWAGLKLIWVSLLCVHSAIYKTPARAICFVCGLAIAIALYPVNYSKDVNEKEAPAAMGLSSLEIDRILYEEDEERKRERIEEMNKGFGEWLKTQETDDEERHRLREKEKSH